MGTLTKIQVTVSSREVIITAQAREGENGGSLASAYPPSHTQEMSGLKKPGMGCWMEFMGIVCRKGYFFPLETYLYLNITQQCGDQQATFPERTTWNSTKKNKMYQVKLIAPSIQWLPVTMESGLIFLASQLSIIHMQIHQCADH